ncbi:MAG TPA: hypothetical protein VNJ02_10195 [Vicinamibacterales bacterium]|nr:hypothetical protein [Vicinamibacterales bacterium]
MIPARLPFYENWLTPPGLRDGKFGLAPLHAVLSFLRLEGQSSYDQIMGRAGQYSADWAYTELSSLSRTIVRSLPAVLRARMALFLSGRLIKQTFRGSRASVRLKKGHGTMDIRASIFCALRETAAFPMCGFYSAAVAHFLQRFDLDADVQVSQCKASGGKACTMAVTIRGERVEQPTAEAA